MKEHSILPLAIIGLLGLTLLVPMAGAAELSDLPKNVGAATENAAEYVDDAILTTRVKGHILAEKGLDSLDISVESKDGVVVLSGQVDNQAQISLAERVAGQTSGVKSVSNKITLKKTE